MAGLYNSQLDAFDLYHQWSEEKRKTSREGPDLPALGHATAGSIGASISNLFTYPLDLIITRLQIQRQLRNSSQDNHEEYESILDAAKKIYDQEGLAGLYTGALQDTLKTAVDSFLFFFVYNSLREARLRTKGRKHHLPIGDELGVGFIAGATAKFFTMPIGTIVTRMQTKSMVRDGSGTRKKATMSGIADEIRREKGLQGFWSGYSATLILTLNPSLTFLFFENLKLVLVPKSKRNNPPALSTFFIAALSKAMASTITYPFSLAKARAQASSKGPTTPETATPEKSSTEAAKRRGHAALQRTIIGTLLEIVQNEGVSALYQGLEGEVLKGFFSHGITMLMKDIVHGLIIKLYFAVLRLSKKYPSTEELTNIAKERADSAASYAKETAESISESTTSAKDTLIERGSQTIAYASQKGQDAASYVQDQSKSAMDFATEQSTNATGYIKDQSKSVIDTVSEQGTNAAGYIKEQSKSVMDTVGEQGTNATDYVSQQSKSVFDYVNEKGQDMASGIHDFTGQVKEKLADQAAGIDEFVKEYVGDGEDD